MTARPVFLGLLLMVGAASAAEVSVADTASGDRLRRAAAYARLAETRMAADSLQTALVAYQAAIANDPDDAHLYYRTALAVREAGSVPLTVRILRTYLRMETDTTRIAAAEEIIRDLGFAPPPTPTAALRADGYIGPEACGSCHADKYEGFVETAHARTSQRATLQAIDGSFAPDEAILRTGNPKLWYEMSATPEGFFQTVHNRVGEDVRQWRERMDLVVGSGKIGQSYLSWRGDRLFQLPVSTFGEGAPWANSPGYPDGKAVLDRPIVPRCLECHSTYFQSVQHGTNIFGRTDYILGVTCERCHGPGEAHAQAAVDGDGIEGTITHPGRLPAERLVQVCGQCHTETGPPKQAPFAFRPGDALAAFYEPGEPSGGDGVHAANQLSRLRQSRCFLESEGMSCITCHDPHRHERGDTASFSARCQTCHEVDVCSMEPHLGDVIGDNCIDCHMPRQRATSTQFQSARTLENPLMPDHRVGIYPDATQRFLEALGSD